MLTLKCYDNRLFSDCHQLSKESDFLGTMCLHPKIQSLTDTSNVTERFLKGMSFQNLLSATEVVHASTSLKKENISFCIEDPATGQLIELYELHFGSAHGTDNIKHLIEKAMDLFYSENDIELVSYEPTTSLSHDKVPDSLITRITLNVGDYEKYSHALSEMKSEHLHHNSERKFGLSSLGILVCCDSVDMLTLNGRAFTNIRDTFLHCTRCIAKDYFDDYMVFREALDN